MTHRGGYSRTPDLAAPDCTGQLRYVGLVRLRERNETGSLEQCAGCLQLVVFHRGRVVIDEPMPPAALPANPGEVG